MTHEIRFGTDGWRARIGFGFTEFNLRRLLAAVGRRFSDREGRPKIAVGHDTRFAARDFAQIATDALLAQGCDVVLSQEACPTPALCLATRELGADLGVQITASHNPYSFLGVKLRAADGSPLGPAELEEIEAEIPPDPPEPPSHRLPAYETQDFVAVYAKALSGWVDMDALRHSPMTVVVDMMHGAQADVPEALGLEGEMRLTTVRAEQEPWFGGGSPEPIPANLEPLAEAVRETDGPVVGLAFDGDGDRLAVADETGDLLWPQEVFALAADDLLRDLPEGVEAAGIARTLPTSQWLDRVAEEHGVPLIETPVGFKYLSRFLLSGEAVVAGEESGGIGFGFHLPERDGMLAALRLVARLGRERRPLSALRSEFRERFGDFSYHRVDRHTSPDVQVRVRADAEAIGEALCSALGVSTDKCRTLDGVKVSLGDGGWVMVRASGTEPLLRIYAEAPLRREVDRLIETAARTVEGLA